MTRRQALLVSKQRQVAGSGKDCGPKSASPTSAHQVPGPHIPSSCAADNDGRDGLLAARGERRARTSPRHLRHSIGFVSEYNVTVERRVAHPLLYANISPSHPSQYLSP